MTRSSQISSAAFVDRIFYRYGGLGDFATTLVLGIRGLAAVPAGLSSYSRPMFLGTSTAGNLVYTLALVAVSFGLGELLGF